MHFLVVSIAFCLMTLANVHADLTDCTPPNSPVKINQIILTPNPPKIGQPLTINGTATVSRPIGDGTVELQAQYYIGGKWEDLPPLSLDYCDILTCPIPAGKRTMSKTVDVPPIPSGSYRGKITATETKTNQQIVCIQFQYNLN